MGLFLWKKSYEVKVPEIDMQHRRLVGLINELSDAMMIKQGFRTVPHVLEELLDYVQQHFTTEENLMQKLDYPGLEEHTQNHLAMTTKVLELKKLHKQDHAVAAQEVLKILCDWLKNHILVSDLEIGKYVRSREVT